MCHIYSCCQLFTFLPSTFTENGCSTLLAGDQSFSETLEYPNMTWFETPSIVPLSAGRIKNAYRSLVRYGF